MSVNASSFSLFKPNPLYRNLREDSKPPSIPAVAPGASIDELRLPPSQSTATTNTNNDTSVGTSSSEADDVDELDAGETLLDVDDDLLDQIRDLQRRNAALQREKTDALRQRMQEIAALKRELDELKQQNEELQQQPKMDDEVIDLVRQLAAEKDALQKQNGELQIEVDEVYALMEQMHQHVESLELHQQSLVAYVNKVCNDVKTVKRRTVWQKIEFDKERQQLVEELHAWKRKAEEFKASEKAALEAAEATAAWEATCLNQTIDQLRGEILAITAELDTAKEALTRRANSAEEAAETEQMLEAVQELALDLKSQVDEANAALDMQKATAQCEIRELQEALSEMKQRSIKQQVAHDRERQELVEEIQMWKHRAEEAPLSTVPPTEPTQSEPGSVTASSSSHESEERGDRGDAVVDEETKENDVLIKEKPRSEPVTNNQGEHNADKTTDEDNQSEVAKPTDKSNSDVTRADSDNQREHTLEASSSTLAVDDEDKDNMPDSPLSLPQRSESFFSRFRTFSFRPRTDSVASGFELDPPLTPMPARSRSSSTASSTTSTASSTTRAAKPKSSPPVTVNTRNDYLSKQDPMRLNSMRNIM